MVYNLPKDLTTLTMYKYNHHNRTPHIGINVYSFGLKPEEHQPSGTCIFFKKDNANLFLNVTENTIKRRYY